MQCKEKIVKRKNNNDVGKKRNLRKLTERTWKKGDGRKGDYGKNKHQKNNYLKQRNKINL